MQSSLLWVLASIGLSFALAAFFRTAENVFLCSLLSLSLASAATSAADFFGHSSTGRLRNCGPFCHTDSSLRSLRSALPCDEVCDIEVPWEPPPVTHWPSLSYFSDSVCEECLALITITLNGPQHSLTVYQVEPMLNFHPAMLLKVLLEMYSETCTTDLSLDSISLLVQQC